MSFFLCIKVKSDCCIFFQSLPGNGKAWTNSSSEELPCDALLFTLPHASAAHPCFEFTKAFLGPHTCQTLWVRVCLYTLTVWVWQEKKRVWNNAWCNIAIWCNNILHRYVITTAFCQTDGIFNETAWMQHVIHGCILLFNGKNVLVM